MLKFSQENEDFYFIVGYCAVQEEGQNILKDVPEIVNLAYSLIGYEKLKVLFRCCGFKPRSSFPVDRSSSELFTGIGMSRVAEKIAPLIDQGYEFATEVANGDHVREYFDTLLSRGVSLDRGTYILWTGARNTDSNNHLLLSEAAAYYIHKYGADIKVMIKNPMSNVPAQTWENCVSYINFGLQKYGMTPEEARSHIMLCFRGFAPRPGQPNPRGYRNLPDFKFADEVRQRTGLPMIYDVSHAPGDKKIKNPFYVGEHKTEIERYTYEVLSDKNTRPSGLIAEASPDPEKAKTDSKQHLDVNELACLCILINSFAS